MPAVFLPAFSVAGWRVRPSSRTVRLNSGETFIEAVPMLRSMTGAEVDAKFRSLATVATSEENVEELLNLGRNLETISNVSFLLPLLTQ